MQSHYALRASRIEVIADDLEGRREGVVCRSGMQTAQNGWIGTLGGG